MHILKSLFFTIFITSFAMENQDHRPLKRTKQEEANDEDNVAIPARNLADYIIDQSSHAAEFYCDRCHQNISTDHEVDLHAHIENFHIACWNCNRHDFSSGSQVRQHLLFECLANNLLRKQ